MNQRICINCGKPLDPNTGLCPNCNPQSNNTIIMDSNSTMQNVIAEAEKQKKKKKSIIIGCSVGGGIAVLVIIALIVCACLGVFSGKEEKESNAPTPVSNSAMQTYATYLSQEIIADIGLFDNENPSVNSTGVQSAEFTDMNNDGHEELIVVYSDSTNGSINHNISCYEIDYADDADDEDRVNNIGNEVLFTEPDSSADEMTIDLPREFNIYSINYQNTNYIVAEYISYLDGYSYYASVLTLVDGEFVEVANICSPCVGTDGTEIVYSTNLPDGMTIDNNDIDFEADFWYYMDVELYDDDSKVMFYQTPGEDGLISYTTYFTSRDDAVKSFFNCFGIEKNTVVSEEEPIEEGRNIKLDVPSNANLIYSYVYYYYRDENNNIIDQFIIKDYTDVNGFINQYGDPNAVNPKAIFNNAAKRASYIFSSEIVDYDDELDYNGYSYCRVTIDNVKTWEDFLNYCYEYYDKESVDNYFDEYEWQHIEYEDNLYIPPPGYDSFLLHEYIRVNKIDDTTYQFDCYRFNDMNSEAFTETYTLSKVGDKWIFDKFINFDTYGCCEFVDDSDITMTRIGALCLYKQPITDAMADDESIGFSGILAYDIDKDGIKELIVESGTCEADALYTVYSYTADSLVKLGTIPAGHSSLYKNSNGDLIIFSGHMGYYEKSKVSISYDKVSCEVIESGDLDELGYDSYDDVSGDLEEAGMYEYECSEFYQTYLND